MSFLSRIARLFQQHEEAESERTSTELTREKERLVEFTKVVNGEGETPKVFIIRRGDFLDDDLFGPVRKDGP